jgi:hypothetical protein
MIAKFYRVFLAVFDVVQRAGSSELEFAVLLPPALRRVGSILTIQ